MINYGWSCFICWICLLWLSVLNVMTMDNYVYYVLMLNMVSDMRMADQCDHYLLLCNWEMSMSSMLTRVDHVWTWFSIRTMLMYIKLGKPMMQCIWEYNIPYIIWHIEMIINIDQFSTMLIICNIVTLFMTLWQCVLFITLQRNLFFITLWFSLLLRTLW